METGILELYFALPQLSYFLLCALLGKIRLVYIALPFSIASHSTRCTTSELLSMELSDEVES